MALKVIGLIWQQYFEAFTMGEFQSKKFTWLKWMTTVIGGAIVFIVGMAVEQHRSTRTHDLEVFKEANVVLRDKISSDAVKKWAREQQVIFIQRQQNSVKNLQSELVSVSSPYNGLMIVSAENVNNYCSSIFKDSNMHIQLNEILRSDRIKIDEFRENADGDFRKMALFTLRLFEKYLKLFELSKAHMEAINISCENMDKFVYREDS